MKNLILLLVLTLSVNISAQEFKSVSVDTVYYQYETYRITARTKSVNNQTEWVDLIVEANITPQVTSIWAVYYNDGYGLKIMNYYRDPYYSSTYYVYISGKTFYFTI